LDELAAQRSNMNAAVNAIRAIDEPDEAAGRPLGNQTTAGIVIYIDAVPAPPAPVTVAPRPIVIDHDERTPPDDGEDQ
jgi:hypothetical protein